MGAPMKEVQSLLRHGSAQLPSVELDTYNLEIKDEEGFVGDRARRSSFITILDGWRKVMHDAGLEDPLGDKPTAELSKKKLDQFLADGDARTVAVLHSALEDFAQALAYVVRRFMRTKGWKDTECITIGGGFSNARAAQIAMARAELILRADGIDTHLVAIAHDPDEAGLIGALHLLPAWMIGGYDGIVAIDIGGTNIRAGVVLSGVKKSADLAKAEVWKSELWRHADEETKRDEAVDRLNEMIQDLVAKAERAKLVLAPVIGIGCPGMINEDGSIEAGAQNLPGNWESSRFNLPNAIIAAIPKIGGHDTQVIMHNDAVVQGLSELPLMTKYARWGVLTIGTGLGNARFTMRTVESKATGKEPGKESKEPRKDTKDAKSPKESRDSKARKDGADSKTEA